MATKKLFAPVTEADFVIRLDGQEIIREKNTIYNVVKEKDGSVLLIIPLQDGNEKGCIFTDDLTQKKLSIILEESN